MSIIDVYYVNFHTSKGMEICTSKSVFFAYVLFFMSIIDVDFRISKGMEICTSISVFLLMFYFLCQLSTWTFVFQKAWKYVLVYLFFCLCYFDLMLNSLPGTLLARMIRCLWKPTLQGRR
jgi:hypothetical protein